MLSALTATAPVLAAALLGRRATLPRLPDWYAALEKPRLTPPGPVFGAVWGALYGLMAAACWRLLQAPRSRARRRALRLYHAQLLLNAAWSPLFFGARSPALGLLDIVPQWLLVLATIRAAGPADRAAARMLAPLAAWVGYAALLNVSIWRRNRGGGEGAAGNRGRAGGHHGP